MTLHTAFPATVLSQFDSESEDYDALPSGPVVTAALIVGALVAIPFLAASIVVIPIARTAAGIFQRPQAS